MNTNNDFNKCFYLLDGPLQFADTKYPIIKEIFSSISDECFPTRKYMAQCCSATSQAGLVFLPLDFVEVSFSSQRPFLGIMQAMGSQSSTDDLEYDEKYRYSAFQTSYQ